MPDNNNSGTPEKELLKFIEDKKTSPELKARSSVRRGKSFISIGGLKARFSYLRANIKNFSFKQLSVDLKIINITLTVIVAVVAVSLVVDLIRAFWGINKEIEQAFAVEQKEHEFQFPEFTSLKNSSYYLEKARKRDIFQFFSDEPLKAAATGKPKKPDEILIKTKDLKLVGIAWSQDPDAMIEDAKSKRTFFLKRGDVIKDVKVEAIFRDRVVLSYQGQEIELK